jgi:hypothetical protein
LIFPQELVQKLEGFKHISWKKDQESDSVHNFSFSIPELPRQSLCLKGAVKTEPSKKLLTDVLPEPVVDCTAKSVSCSSVMLATASLENGNSENESEGGDTEQRGDICSHGMLEGTTDRVWVATDETTAGPESTGGATESMNSCVTLESGKTAAPLLPNSQTSLPEKTEVSEAQRLKEKQAECFGPLNEMNLPVDLAQGIATQCHLMPPNAGPQLNDTFVLPRASTSCAQIKTPGRLAQRRNIQPKVHNTGNTHHHHNHSCLFTCTT